MELLILIIYGFALTVILGYGILQFGLIRNAQKFTKSAEARQTLPVLDLERAAKIPRVTVQLPVYNEYYVVERLIDAVAAFRYPPDQLEIQVLDDSTDETVDLIRDKVNTLQKKGYDIQHIHRNNRTGYKAGALANGLKHAKGEFIAIFDADFIPRADFLIKTLPQFTDNNIGLVQTRWGHVNKHYSLLTRLQAFGLNAHFGVEQTGRYFGGYFLNFNGTGGIWRKKCIEDAGGWQQDTLAEDLDLSYRAQLKNWRFVYLNRVEAPAELPVLMSALKSQQFRWTKGGAENCRKLASRILGAKHQPLSTRLFALSHLMNNSLFIFIFITGIVSLPALFIKYYHPEYTILFYIGSVFIVAMLIFLWFYWSAYHYQGKRKFWKPFAFLYHFLLFLSFSMGLSLHNSIAVIEGYMGKKSTFVRTPKFNLQHQKKAITKYLHPEIHWITWLEGLLCLYFTGGIIAGFILQDFGLIPFYTMFAFGFGCIFYYSMRQVWLKNI